MSRKWYRSASTGQRGELVEHEGAQMILLDRPMEKLYKPFDENEWIPDASDEAFTRIQIARIAFAADRELAKALGDYAGARTEWETIAASDSKRARWLEKGPDSTHPLRRRLWKAITGALPTKQ